MTYRIKKLTVTIGITLLLHRISQAALQVQIRPTFQKLARATLILPQMTEHFIRLSRQMVIFRSCADNLLGGIWAMSSPPTQNFGGDRPPLSPPWITPVYGQSQTSDVGQMKCPTSLAVTKNDDILVADQGNNRILSISRSTGCVQELALSVDGIQGPRDLCLDESRGRLYVGEVSDQHRVLVFDGVRL